MDSYGEICYEVGLDLEPNKYAKLRKAAMLAQEEQNDPLPCALLCLDELFLRIREKLRPKKQEKMLEGQPPRRRIHQVRDMEIITSGISTLVPSNTKDMPGQDTYEQDPYAIASAPDNHSPNSNGGLRTTAITPSSSPPRPSGLTQLRLEFFQHPAVRLLLSLPAHQHSPRRQRDPRRKPSR